MSTIRLAIAGVGNCASSLVQGIEYYKDADPTEDVPGLMHVDLGGYHVRDIEVVAAFDVDADKVGIDVAKAIHAGPNNTIRFADVPDLGVTVLRGPTLDGFGEFYTQECEESPAEPVDVAQALRDAQADVLVSYLPVGSEEAQKHYAQACLDAGVAFVNAIPVFIASDPEWAAKFTEAGVPIVGDDIKSQVGATIVHRTLARLFEDRGTTIDHTYQLNFGGNMDFMNMLERKRLKSKKMSKTQSVTSQIEAGISDSDVHIGPSDHVPWLEDRKWAFIRLEGRNFGDVPLTVELKLEVHDSPNSAGVIIDAVRCAKLAQDRGIGGPVDPACQYFMKSPPTQVHDDVARDSLDAFIADALTSAAAPTGAPHIVVRGRRRLVGPARHPPRAPAPNHGHAVGPRALRRIGGAAGPGGRRHGRLPERPLDAATLRCLRYMHDIEHHTVCYLRDLLVTPVHRDPAATTFLTVWNYEEMWHGDAIARVLAAHGEDAGGPRVRRLRQHLGVRDRLAPALHAVGAAVAGEAFGALHMTWGAVNEWTTQAGYARLAERAGHPVLSELLRRIMRQEGRHIAYYASEAERRLTGRRGVQRSCAGR